MGDYLCDIIMLAYIMLFEVKHLWLAIAVATQNCHWVMLPVVSK